jgi:transcription-repair coupling factor (superfamily II helicase)
LEFFGDELESLREFDPATQISRETVESVRIPPAGEISLLKAAAKAASSAPGTAVPEPSWCTLFDHLPEDALVILVDPDALLDEELRQAQQVPPGDPFHADWTETLEAASRRGRTVISLPVSEEPEAVIGSLDAYRPIGATLPEAAVAEAQRREFFHQMHRWFRELWGEYGLASGEPAAPTVHLGALSRGFHMPAAAAVVVTDAEIYGRYKVSRARRLKSPHAQAVRSAFEVDFSEFEEDDYVVHLQHGIGRYRGLTVLAPSRGRDRPATTDAGGGQECLVIEYAPREPGEDPPKLYVPVTEAHLVSKYVGAGKARPQLSTLGGNRWNRAREQAESAVRDLASDLLRVQAARAAQEGAPLPADTHWQQEFEAAFEYEETPDQVTAIAAVKRDQESARPMDRLLCGDVGFGKTEVAIRAAFKAVMSGRQAAVLVPTTVLAQQHFNHFRERMAVPLPATGARGAGGGGRRRGGHPDRDAPHAVPGRPVPGPRSRGGG